MRVTNRAELEALPDGTIVTWLRIPGDPTSEAVAFVRHEDEWIPASDPERDGTTCRTTWVSPGGWHPLSPEEAGVSYPCLAFTDPMPTAPIDVLTLDQGGTWSREKALEAASRVYQGCGMEADNVLHEGITALAETFDDWLTRDPLAEALSQLATQGQMTLGDMAEALRSWKAQGITRASTYYVVEQVWPYDDSTADDVRNEQL